MKLRSEINSELEAILAKEAHEAIMLRADSFCYAYCEIKSALSTASIDHKFFLGPAIIFADRDQALNAIYSLKSFKQTGWVTYTHFTGMLQAFFSTDVSARLVLLNQPYRKQGAQ
ncbi:hypothetical protein FS594_15730 [Rahnella aquatilis]|nr:hypothetical protein FS594_15730 [Rahnella aquatilis]